MRPRLDRQAVFVTVLCGLLQVSRASISFDQIQPIFGFPSSCTKAYETTVNGCSFSELSLLGGSGCSANCEIALEAAENFIQRTCAGLSAPGDSLIGQIFVGNLISFLCTPTSSPTTTAMTTAAASPSTSVSMASDTSTAKSTAASGSASTTTTTKASSASGSAATTESNPSSTSASSNSRSVSSSATTTTAPTTTLTTSFTSTSTTSADNTSASSTTQSSGSSNGNNGDSGGGSPFDAPFSTGAGVANMPQHQLLFFCLCVFAWLFGLR
ncbi:hypothetical protein PV08_02035 [Exophiala spinifera]|uniref:Extracellular membrane protein CFEM domain-containing protein n=1 Tax=Exophiala spinifera TaxID=91928 RepID=A0A0D2BSQ8_9EURO|nr:uncharacterized protein PV08_02035 [Exophiala spinifera]KIW21455.1 hypothetical protein PV08_02035 [Exophiala spinifera]